MSERSVVSPYVGLIPFNEKDSEFFFGRENDIEIIATNLRAARLTVFYGISGVGKSSVIRAGVLPYLQKMTALSTLPDEPPDFLIIVLREWASNPIDSLRLLIKETVKNAVADKKLPYLNQTQVDKIASENQNNRNLNKLLKNWTDLIETKLLIILDQFEDFFLHPEFSSGEGSFGEEFPKAVNDFNLPVNFMISLRDDSVAKLDFFKCKIHEPMNNTLRLKHLDRTLAEQAIRKPLDKYNEKMGTAFTIEDEVVNKILDEVQVGKIKLGIQGQAKVKQIDLSDESTTVNISKPIETPYLQLVMLRLWEDEKTQTEKCLTLDTLENKLNGVEDVVKTHLDKVMNSFNIVDKKLISEFIHFTVTRSGAKIASTATGLADWANLPERQEDIDRILRTLSSGDKMIYKPVQNLNDPETKYYEVSHDALAPAILNWRTRYLENNRLSENTIRLAWRYLPWIIVIVLLIIIFAAMFGISESWKANQANANANAAQQAKTEIKDTKVCLEKLIFILSDLAVDKTEENRKDVIVKWRELNEEDCIPEYLIPSLNELADKIASNSEESKEIRDILNKPSSPNPKPTLTADSNPDEKISPRVYIHISNENQRSSARAIEKILESDKTNGFIVPGIENVGAKSPDITEIRYFRSEDSSEATKVMNILRQNGIKNVRMLSLNGSSKIRPKHLEIWFAADAFPLPKSAK